MKTRAHASHIDCPDCAQPIPRIHATPGSRLTCDSCGSHFRIAAREAILSLQRRPSQSADEGWSGQHAFLCRHRRGCIVLMLLSFFLPGLIPLWLLIGGILLFSNVFADPSSVAESRPPSAVATNPSGPRDNTENGVPRTSRLAWLCAMVGLALLIGGVSLAILDDVIQQELLTLSPTEMVVILVCLAAGAIPGLIGLILSGTAWRRCGQRHLGGRGLAAAALLMSTLYLAGLGQTFHRSHQSMVRWRAIEQLASQQDPSTLDALETEVVHPASRGTRQRAARLLANHAPERALSLIRHGSVASCRALLESLQDSQHQKFASAARHVYKKRISGPASELLSSRGWPPLERQSSDHHKPAAFRR